MNTRKPKPAVIPKEKNSDPVASQFPIVCIGASAGGLEALEQFLGNVPAYSGMAYIVIQHLDPTQKGMLPELLQRVSKIPVVQAKDRMTVRPNGVYVIPPNKTMSIFKGVLHLFEPIEIRGLRLPIDFFMRSLADDRREMSVGVILSGMGSDGSTGIRAIKEKNGIVMVQEPDTAKFDSMPRNALTSVQADIVAPANELPGKLLAFHKHIPVIKSGLELDVKNQTSLEKIIILLRIQTGNDFSLYKRNTVYRRIERRMGVHKIEKITSYVHFLQENPKEIEILFKELMIGVTNFFRDANVWEKLKENVIPAILVTQPANSVLRAWIPGCSTGEEAYSLAIIFKEAIEKIRPQGGFSLQIFATDLDNEAIESARKGYFPSNITADVSTERLNRFFTVTDGGYLLKTEIREMIVFAHHNIILHPPFTNINIISCRNLLIYLETELQLKLLSLFYYSLNPEGILLLGNSESLGAQGHLFSAIDNKLKIYKRSGNNPTPELFDFPSSFARIKSTITEKQVPAKLPVSIQSLADQLLLQQFSPPGVLVNGKGDIIYISGRTGKYLEPAVGKANLNIFAMLREGLRNEFPAAFRKAIMTKDEVVIRNIKTGTNGGTQTVNVTIRWIDKPEPLNGMLIIIFTDVPDNIEIKNGSIKGKKTILTNRLQELETELQKTREEMQSTLEEMQTSQEELKSANEELQSTNEELQSTNEELTSSKEEMQSLNEELQTVNAELQSKVDEFSRVNNDMKNLLNSTDIATLFLDKELNIRRFTNQATKIFKLIKSDIGRPFTDQVSDLVYPEMTADALEVLRTLIYTEKQVTTRDKRWYSVRIMPYRTSDDRIDGLVITFINISEHKHLEAHLLETGQEHNWILNSSSDLIVKLSTKLKILDINPKAEKYFGKKHSDVTNQNFLKMFIPEKAHRKVENELNILLSEMHESSLLMPIIVAKGNITEVDWRVCVLLDALENPSGLILISKNNSIHD